MIDFKNWFNNKYFETELGYVIQDDFFSAIKNLPQQSIDFNMSDIPYGTTRCKWESIWDLNEMWGEFNRIHKPNTAVVMTAQTPFDKILGASYITDHCLSYDERYCETCGDSDTLIDSGIKEELIMKYTNTINKEEALQKWFFQKYKILPDDYGYVETVKSIIGDNINLEDNFWVICPDNQDCYTPYIGTIDEFQKFLESDLPQECKFCAFQELLNRIDNE